MAEYIDREKFRNRIHDVTNDQNCPLYIAVTIEQYIDEEPATDVAPVVRCKDCIHLIHGGKTKDGTLYFPQCIYSTIISLKPDDFCSYGKRRLENE